MQRMTIVRDHYRKPRQPGGELINVQSHYRSLLSKEEQTELLNRLEQTGRADLFFTARAALNKTRTDPQSIQDDLELPSGQIVKVNQVIEELDLEDLAGSE